MTATRSRSKWLRIGGGVLLLILALLLVPFVVPVDRFRPLLVRLVEDATGRTVEIQALRLRLLPTVHLQVVNLRIKHPPGFPSGDTLVVKSVDIGTTLRSLLARRPEVTSVAVSGVRVNLLAGPGGATNYAIAAPGARPGGAGATGPRNAPAFALGPIDAVTARDVEITAGVYDPRSGVVTPSLAIAGINVRLRGIDVNAPDWIRRMVVVADLGGITLSTPALQRPLRMQKGSASLEGGKVTGTFAASLDTMRVSGTVAVASLRDPVADFDIAVPELDMDKLRTLMRGGGMTPGGGPGGPRRLLARGTIKIARLVARPLEGGPATGRILIYSDQVAVNPYSLALYGGTVQGTVAVDAAAARLPVQLTVKARGLDFARAEKAVAPAAKQRITGTLEADARLALALGGDPLASLSGGGKFAVRNGALPGLDIRNTLATIAQIAQVNVPAGSTRFSYFGGDFRIAHQRVYSEALRLEAEGLEGTARGSAGFDRTLDYTGAGTITGTVGPALPGAPSILGTILGGTLGQTGGAFTARVPFALRGTFDDPKFSPTGLPQLTRGPTPQPQQPTQPGRNPLNLLPIPFGP